MLDVIIAPLEQRVYSPPTCLVMLYKADRCGHADIYLDIYLHNSTDPDPDNRPV